MNSLLGMELPTAVNFVIAFVVVLLLIGAATWLVRRVGAGRGEAAARGRLPRLAVVDAAAVDGRRKLVIVRRDNVEHLLMIGGPTDVVVETNIVRATAAAAREIAPARNGAAETAPRAMPLPDPTPWPLQPEPVPGPLPSLRTRNAADEAWRTPGETPSPAPEVRAVRPVDTLAGLAEELARPITEPAAPPRAPAPAPQQPSRPAAAQQQVPTTNVPLPGPGAEQSLAEMAQRLEAALRRPNAQKIVADGQRVTATVEVKGIVPKPASAPPQKPVPAKPQSGNLEQEMASLLGKPGKT